MIQTIGLADCNNFYVSCERIFNYRLRNTPVVVLSSNDGCIIARSNEAKLLGIPMGVPFYQYKDICRRHNVKAISSNYELYSDISDRVMSEIANFIPYIEIYSIDEAFLDLTGIRGDLTAYMERARERVLNNVGIPISIGIANTKTLAKLANKIAKKTRSGVCDFTIMYQGELDTMLQDMAVDEIWGIGYKSAARLNARNIFSVWDFKYAEKTLIRDTLHVGGLKTHNEINNFPCNDILDHVRRTREPKSVSSTRTFSGKVRDKYLIKEALMEHTRIACRKLKEYKMAAKRVSIFIRTGKYNDELFKYKGADSIILDNYTNDDTEIFAAVKTLLDRTYLPGIAYKRSGIYLTEFIKESMVPKTLFQYTKETKRHELTQLIKKINDQFKGTNQKNYIQFGHITHKKVWNTKRDARSPRYTTQWEEIPVATR